MILDRALVRLLPAVPRPVVRSISSRYIAGPELSDASATVRARHCDSFETGTFAFDVAGAVTNFRTVRNFPRAMCLYKCKSA